VALQETVALKPQEDWVVVALVLCHLTALKAVLGRLILVAEAVVVAVHSLVATAALAL
jgi:hypothetical protein